MEAELILVLVTVPNIEVGRHISIELINSHLAACVNILPSVTSIYRWEGKLEESSELLLVIKSSQIRYSELETCVKRLHPYDTPEVVAIAASNVSEKYLSWVLAETGG